jgi:hypothetical protein
MSTDKEANVVCRLWPYHDRRFNDLQYGAWWGRYNVCNSKVIVTKRMHLLMGKKNIRLLCEQCDEIERNSRSKDSK